MQIIFTDNPHYPRIENGILTRGTAYTVIGFSILTGPAEKTMRFDVMDKRGHLTNISGIHCEIIDGRPSAEWILGVGNESALTCWPEIFYNPKWVEDLLDHETSAVAKFTEIERRISSELGYAIL